MQIYLSGVVRGAHLEVVSQLHSVGVVLDFSYREIKDDALLKDLLKHFKGRGMPILATHRSEAMLSSEEYLSMLHRYYDFFDIVHLSKNDLPKDLSDKSLLDLKELDQFDSLVGQVRHIGIGKGIEVKALRNKASQSLPALRATNTRIHAWGMVDKEAICSGVFASASSPSWISGGRYGNTYNYVGNLKMVTHHGTKGRGKEVRQDFSSKCKMLGVDHSKLIADDTREVNLWNAHQWDLYAKDASLAGGYWLQREVVKMTDEKSKASEASNLQHQLAIPQARQLASQDAGARYLRSCDSCFLSSNCPAFEPQSSCKISTRPRVDHPDDIQDLLNRIIEIQGERVMFAAYAEKTQNMGANPDVAKEMETLTKIIKDTKDIFSTSSGDEVTIKAKGSGVISKIFGSYGRGGGGGSKPSQSENIIDISPMEGEDD